MLPRLSLLVLVMLCFSSARADVVATCGASEGWGYYVAGGGSPIKRGEWLQDKVSGGSFQLIRAGNDWDLVFTDATGGTVSARGDGAQTLGITTPDGDVVLTLFYPKLIETYVFWLSHATPTASYSQAKFATTVRKHALFVAPCRRAGAPAAR